MFGQNQYQYQQPGSYYNPAFPAVPLYPQQRQAQPQYQPLQYIPLYFVDGDAGAQAMPIEQGQSATGLDKKRMIFYLRSMSQNGEFDSHKFRLVEIEENQNQGAEYATAEELAQIRQELEQLTARINGTGAGGNE